MFDYAWVRFIVASLLLGAYGITDGLSKLAGWRHRPPRVRRPVWSHLLGFVSVILFYGAVGRYGGSLWNGQGNQIGVALCVLAMVLRFMASGGGGPVRHPDLVVRLFFFAALPLVVGSPRAWLVFLLPQSLIAAKEAVQRDEALKKAAARDDTESNPVGGPSR